MFLPGCVVLALLSSFGCGSSSTGGSGGTTPPSVSALTLSAASLTFPSTTVGQTSATQTLTLTDTGTATLVLNSFNVSDPTDFSDTTTCGTSLASGASCTFTIAFTPKSAAALSSTITVTDNAANSPQTVTLSGTGTAVPAPVAGLSVSALTFTANVPAAAGAQTVTLTNTGNATLSNIAVTLGGGASSSAFSDTTTCGATLAAGSMCTISVNFTPTTFGGFSGVLSIADNATSSPQTVALTGTGYAPQVTLSSNSVSFPTTRVGSTSAASSLTLTNTGNATLNITSIVLGGSNPANFGETTTCGATLAANASCSISPTFTPAGPTLYSAAIVLTDNAPGTSPQSIALSGSGTSSAVSYTLYTFPAAFPETSDANVSQLYALINSAKKTIDMTMYALEDTTFSGYLVAACQKGVVVRVVLDVNLEKSGNTPAYNQLNAQTNCSAVWANIAFQATHQKSFIIDGTQVAIMSLNLQSQYYTTTRDFAMIENDPVDIAALQATFNADYAAGTPSGGTQGASDFSYAPGPGDDLIWSPTTAQSAMLAIINNAKSTLLVENEEMGASNIVSALETACQKGVVVHIAMVSQSSYATNFKALEAAGCGVHVYPNTQTGFYIHAKAVVADYGLSTQSVYMGSINYSNASMTQNRELGMYINDPASVQSLQSTIASDYAGGTAY
jgi:hypothetical protein